MKINLQTTLILIALSAFSLPSYARVYEYVFKDVYGTDKSVSAEAGILNTNEKIQVRIISGLDRKIQVTVKKDNVGVYSFTTESVTVNDRIKASTGEEFYGKTLTLPPLSDGSYVITSDILNTQNTVIDSTSHNFIIDTVGPLSDNLSVDQNPGYDMVLTGERWELGLGAEAKLYLNVKNVKSATGFDKATIQVIKPDDTVFSTTDMVYDSGSASLSIPWTKGNMSRSSWMPVSNADVEYRFRVTLYDKAGNHKVFPDQKFIFDSDLGEYTLFAVYDPTSKTSVVPGFSEGYIAYKPGMTVNQNPLTLVYRVPSNNRREYSKAGLKFGTIISEANGYSYVSAKTAYKVAYVIHNGYQWGGGSLSYNINLGSEAPASPAAPEVWLTSDIKGEMNAGSYLWDSKDLPVKFSSVKITASPRNYGQRAMSGNTEICQIPAGETECTGAVSWSIPKSGNGITTYFFRLTDMDKTLSSVTVEKRHHWNTDLLPKITGYSYQEENKTVLLFVTQPGRGKFRDLLQLKSAALIDSDTGDQLLSGIQTALSGEDYTYSFDLSKLAEGKYNLGFLAKDSFNNETSSPFINLINDKTPPVVNFKYENAPLSPGATVFGLENISITLNDELTAPSLVRLELKGGPASDSVILGFNQNTDGSYTPDYPRLFPSLDANTDKYTLTAYATDAKGNTTQKSIQFAYYPKNLVTLEKLKTLGVVKALKTSDNTPLAVMRTGQLRRNDGSLAKGIQTANITVRKDADYAINILGNVIHPGETKEIQIDLGTGENSTVPIFTAENGSTGESNFIIEFPQIK
ncbi:TPA: Ig-like domain repeat protein [Klebsiella pneumoniae]|nr:Ig-like domain repeat protein [Klebsiella pneumoniae]HCD7676004.1 Ig-like domain repeat protein [Klebsiella pneumoniae]